MDISKNRFSTLIRVKSHQEKIAQQELSSIKEQKNKEIEVFDHLEETQNTAIDVIAQKMKIRATELQSDRAYIQNLRQQMQEQLKKINTMQDKEDGKRIELVEKSQSKKIIEKLEEKRITEAEMETSRKEQRLMDVLANRIRWGNY